jgi:hypothetical protein
MLMEERKVLCIYMCVCVCVLHVSTADKLIYKHSDELVQVCRWQQTGVTIARLSQSLEPPFIADRMRAST